MTTLFMSVLKASYFNSKVYEKSGSANTGLGLFQLLEGSPFVASIHLNQSLKPLTQILILFHQVLSNDSQSHSWELEPALDDQ